MPLHIHASAGARASALAERGPIRYRINVLARRARSTIAAPARTARRSLLSRRVHARTDSCAGKKPERSAHSEQAFSAADCRVAERADSHQIPLI
jgi:hypothetical protein